MSKELVISSNRHETKVAILEDDQLVEIYFQRANEYSLAGSIHKGRVTRVLPGMQSAFVDLGLERDTFLYVSDFFEESEEYDRIVPARDDRSGGRDRGSRERPDRMERPPMISAAIPPVIPSLVIRNREEAAIQQAEDEAPLEAAPVPDLEDSPEVLEASQVERTASELVLPERSAGFRPEDANRAGQPQGGRRGRRRRNRGRGFPDSKYASEVTAAPVSARPVRETPAETPEPETPGPSRDFAVLPGESLAKYRHAPDSPPERRDPEDGASEDRAAETSRPEHAVADDTDEPVSHAGFGAAGAALAREPQFTSQHEPEFEPEVEPSDAELEAEAASEIIAEEREAGRFAPEDIVDSPMPALEFMSGAYPEDAEPVMDEPGGSPAETALGADAEAPGTAESMATGGAAPAREPGGRSMHRLPRRMRRKMRSEGRPPQDISTVPAPRAEQPRTVVTPVVLRPEKSGTPSITDLLKEGQEILVQIAKEPLGQKGARITSHIALPGRYVVFMPTLEHMGVSRKIASDEERQRLKRILQTHSAGMTGGFIIRTAGETRTEEEIAADMRFLYNLWIDIREKSEKRPAPVLLHHDLDIVQRTLRDQVSESFKAIWMDNEELYESVLRFVQRFQPGLVGRVKLYTRSAPIFDAFNITPELEKALRPKVWLKSGGYIVINQTEALVAIDVNTGKYVGKSNRLEDTIVKTNTEAVKEIVRQIRLRDLGGIIVVDFIDMDERKNRQRVMQTLEEAMRSDKAPNKILQFNDFGLVAITRKRVKQSLERALCSPCPYCEGAGYVKSVQTTVADILQESHKIASAVEGKDVMLRVHPDVAKYLKSNQNRYLEEMEEILRRPVMVKADPTLHHEKFDLV